MSYSVIGIGCTLFSIIRSSSGAHSCHKSNSEPDRIEMITMDGKSQKIWAAELAEYPSKKGKSYAGYWILQPNMHLPKARTHQSATRRLCV